MNPPIKPTAAPGCWGIQFEDGSNECIQCPFKDSCRPVVMNRLTGQYQTPSAAPQPSPFRPTFPGPPQYPTPQPQSSLVPLTARPFAPTLPTAPPPPMIPVSPIPQHLPLFSPQRPQSYAPVPQAPQYQQPAYQPQHPQPWQAQAVPSLPDPNHPNPLMAMARPGTQGAAYYLTQYPGESTMQRITKNALLRALEAVFTELANFFRHWTWPSKS